MNASSPPVSFTPVVPNRWHALGGIWRLTFRKFLLPGHWLALAGLLVVLAVLALPALLKREDAVNEYVEWIINSYLLFLVPILSFISAGGALRDEMKGPTVDYVFTRPVARNWFLLCKFVSHLACAQLDFLLGLVVVVALGLYSHAPHVLAAVPQLYLGQFLLVTVFSAFGFLCGVLTSRYIVIGLIYGAAIEVGVGQIPTQLSRLSMTHQVKTMLRALDRGGGRVARPVRPRRNRRRSVPGFRRPARLGGFGFSLRELSGPDEA